MYALIEDRGRQYKIKQGDRIRIDHVDIEQGQTMEFPVIGLKNADGLKMNVADIKAVAKVIGESKAPKVTAFKFRRRKKSRTKKGHRQLYTEVLIESITS